MNKFIRRLRKFLGSREIWALIFLIVCVSTYLIISGAGMPPVSVPLILTIFVASSIFRVQNFGGNSNTFWWILFPPVFLISCLLMKEHSEEQSSVANKTIRETFVGTVFLIFFLGLGSIYLWGQWRGSSADKPSGTSIDVGRGSTNVPSYDDCYQKGVQYFSDIGVLILTTPPDKGKFATEVVKERCRRSTMAFGR